MHDAMKWGTRDESPLINFSYLSHGRPSDSP